MNRQHLVRSLPLLLLLCAGMALLLSGWFDRIQPQALAAMHEQLHGHVRAHPFSSAAIHIVVIAAVVATSVPGAILLVLAGGMLFGAVTGALLSMVGVCGGATLLFLASRRAFASGEREAPGLAAKLRERYHAHPWSFTFFVRLVPVLPFGAVTLALAWLRCPLRLFVVTTLVGSSVMLVLQSTIGANLVDIVAREGGWSTSALLAPGIVVPTLALAIIALLPLLVDLARRRR